MSPVAALLAPAASIATPIAHAAAVGPGGGNPLYGIDPDHAPAVIAALLLPVVVLGLQQLAAGGSRRAVAIRDGYLALRADRRLVAWVLAASAIVHLGLGFVHGEPGLRLAFLADAAVLGLATRGLLLGRRWRAMATLGLAGGIVAYGLTLIGGEAPDQVGIATKLVELLALGLVLRPRDGARIRGLAATAMTVALVVGIGLSAWVGAFRVSAVEDAVVMPGGHGHGGAVPPPGTVMPAVEDRPPTAGESAVVAALHDALTRSIARYADPEVARADGYEVPAVVGLDVHASNAAYEHDGRILDPARPETLVYAAGPHGPVLLGAMFLMPSMREPGPAVGGPLTVWHAHEHVCLGLLPPGLAGIVSPLGGCPAGTVDLPRTAEMIHAWIIPGAPAFGDLDDEARRAYLATR